MVQEIIPTSLGREVGQSFKQGMSEGQQLYSQLLPLLLNRQINQQIYNPQGAPAPNAAGGASQAAPGTHPIPQQQAPRPSNSILKVLTNEEINAEKARIAALGGDPIRREQEIRLANEANQVNRDRLIKVGQAEGIADKRIGELLAFGDAHPELKTPESIVGAAKKEFGRIEKLDIPGFWENLLKGPQVREEALKRQVPYAQALKKSGREQEGRSSYSENGLSETEINYLFNPPSEKTQASIKALPDGSFKGDNLSWLEKQIEATIGKGSIDKFSQTIEKHPKIIEQQNARLKDFFSNNINPETSLLVLRDQLYRKGYDWRQIATAFNEAVPDASLLNNSQQAELTEFNQAPIPSLSDLFGAGFGRRLAGVLQGKR